MSEQNVAIEPQPHCEQVTEATHALAVRSHVSVPEFGGAREAVDRLLLRLAELLLGPSQSQHACLELGGALADGGLERHPAQAALELEATAAERVCDVDQKLVVVEGLDDVAVRAELERLLGDLRVVGAGDHDRRRLRMLGRDVLDELEAGLARHVQVAESEVEGRAREQVTRHGSVPGRFAVVAVPAEHASQHRLHALIVVDDQDSWLQRGHAATMRS